MLESRANKDNLGEIIKSLGNLNFIEILIANLYTILELEKLMERDIQELSGGELQRFAIAMCAIQEADIYMFDEPSSYLDVRQRLRAAEVIRSLSKDTKFDFFKNLIILF